MFKYQYFKRSIRGASQTCRHEKRIDIRMDSSVEEGLSLEGGMPPSPEGRRMMQMQVHLLKMRGCLSMSKVPLQEWEVLSLENAVCRRGLR